MFEGREGRVSQQTNASATISVAVDSSRQRRAGAGRVLADAQGRGEPSLAPPKTREMRLSIPLSSRTLTKVLQRGTHAALSSLQAA